MKRSMETFIQLVTMLLISRQRDQIWPKFRHFGKLLEPFAIILRAYYYVAIPTLVNCCAIWPIAIDIDGQILNKSVVHLLKHFKP